MAAGDRAYWSDLSKLVEPAVCKLVKSDAQAFASAGSPTALTFGAGTEEIKTHASMHSTSTNTSRIVVPYDGLFEVRCNLVWAFNNTLQYGDILIYLNGSAVSYSGNFKYTTPHSNNVSLGGWSHTDLLEANSGDYFEMRTRQVSSGAAGQTTNASEPRTRFSVAYKRPKQ